MTLKVIESESKIETGGAIVIVESNGDGTLAAAIEALTDTGGARCASDWLATKGLASAALTTISPPIYPVDKEGKPLKGLGQTPAAYRGLFKFVVR